MKTHEIIEQICHAHGCRPHELKFKNVHYKDRIVACKEEIVKQLMVVGFTLNDISDILSIGIVAIKKYSEGCTTYARIITPEIKNRGIKDPKLKHAASLLRDGMSVRDAGFCAGYTKRENSRVGEGYSCTILSNLVEEAGGRDAFVAKHIYNQ